MTAAHCICDPLDPDDKSFRIRICIKPNGNIPQPTNRVNQHFPFKDTNGEIVQDDEMISHLEEKTTSDSFNHLTVQIGSRDLRSGVYQQVKFAYVMYTDSKYGIYDSPDIGLIILETEIDQNGNYPEVHVSPLCLPSRYDIISITLTLRTSGLCDP